jgi:hypothetical protein
VRLVDGRLVELTSGVDAFYLSGVGVLPVEFMADLTHARDEARATRQACVFSLGAEEFRVSGGGLQRYGFRLDHSRGVIAFSTSSSLPAVRVQPRASFLHAVGVVPGLAWFTKLVESVLGTVVWTASRVDLFMDSHGWDLRADDRERFVCRAGQRVTYEDSDLLTGLRFGSSKSGTVMARVYDKTAEIRIKGTDWWPAKWGDFYRPGERVLRVEFQVGRDLMREIGVSDPSEVLGELPSLWGYLTEEWLTYRNSTGDSTRSRWPIAYEWRDVQAATLRGDAIGLERVGAGQTVGSIRRLLPALRGYLSSAGALLGAQTLEDTLHGVNRLIADDAEKTDVSFASRIAAKHIALGLT